MQKFLMRLEKEGGINDTALREENAEYRWKGANSSFPLHPDRVVFNIPVLFFLSEHCKPTLSPVRLCITSEALTFKN